MSASYLKLLDHLYWVPNGAEYKKLLLLEYAVKYPEIVAQRLPDANNLFIAVIGQYLEIFPQVLTVTSWRYSPASQNCPAWLELSTETDCPVMYHRKLRIATKTLQACVQSMPVIAVPLMTP